MEPEEEGEVKMDVVETPIASGKRGRKRKSLTDATEDITEESSARKIRSNNKGKNSSSALKNGHPLTSSLKRANKRQKASDSTAEKPNRAENHSLPSVAGTEEMEFEELSTFDEDNASERSVFHSVSSKISSRNSAPSIASSQNRKPLSTTSANIVAPPAILETKKTPQKKTPRKVRESMEEEELEIRSTSSTISSRSITSNRSSYSTLSRPTAHASSIPFYAPNNTVSRRTVGENAPVRRYPSLNSMLPQPITRSPRPNRTLINQNVTPVVQPVAENHTTGPITNGIHEVELPPPAQPEAVKTIEDERVEDEVIHHVPFQYWIYFLITAFILASVGFIQYGSTVHEVLPWIRSSASRSHSSLTEILLQYEQASDKNLEKMNQDLEAMIHELKPQLKGLKSLMNSHLNVTASSEEVPSGVLPIGLTEEQQVRIDADRQTLLFQQNIDRVIQETEILEKEVLGVIEEIKSHEAEVVLSPPLPSTSSLLAEFSPQIEQTEGLLDETIQLIESNESNLQEIHHLVEENLEKIEHLMEEFDRVLSIPEEVRAEIEANQDENPLVTDTTNQEDENKTINADDLVQSFDKLATQVEEMNNEYDPTHYEEKKKNEKTDGSWEIDRYLAEQAALDPSSTLTISDKEGIAQFVGEITATVIAEEIDTAAARVDNELPLEVEEVSGSSISTDDHHHPNTNDRSSTEQEDDEESSSSSFPHHRDDEYYSNKIINYGVDLAVTPRGGIIIPPNGRDTSFYYNTKIPISFIANLLPKNHFSNFHVINDYHLPTYGNCFAIPSKGKPVISIKLFQPMWINAIAITFLLPPEDSSSSTVRAMEVDQTASIKDFQIIGWERSLPLGRKNDEQSSSQEEHTFGPFEFLFPENAQRYLDTNESHYYREVGAGGGGKKGEEKKQNSYHLIERKENEITNYYELRNSSSSSATSPLQFLQKIKLQVLSNYGNPQFTCIYRIKVFGIVN